MLRNSSLSLIVRMDSKCGTALWKPYHPAGCHRTRWSASSCCITLRIRSNFFAAFTRCGLTHRLSLRNTVRTAGTLYDLLRPVTSPAGIRAHLPPPSRRPDILQLLWTFHLLSWIFPRFVLYARCFLIV